MRMRTAARRGFRWGRRSAKFDYGFYQPDGRFITWFIRLLYLGSIILLLVGEKDLRILKNRLAIIGKDAIHQFQNHDTVKTEVKAEKEISR